VKILQLDSSALGADSASRALTAAIATALASNGVSELTYRDLADQPLPPVDGALLKVLRPQSAEAPQVPAPLQAAVNLAEVLLAEFLSADVVVIGAPMYNFSIPSTLKTWIDRIVLPGRTFTYTAQGPQGLVSGKRVIVASTRGSQLVGQPYEAALDHQEAYLRTVFSFIGLNDINFVRAEGLGLGPDARSAGMQAALTHAQAFAGSAA